MLRLLMAGLFTVGMMGSALAQGHRPHGESAEEQEIIELYNRLNRVEIENIRLRQENERLKATLQRQNRSYSSSYSYGQNSLAETNRKLQEANQLKRNWELLTR